MGKGLWKNRSNDSGQSIKQLEDGSFILCGLYKHNAFLMKTDEKGRMEWLRNYGGEGYEIAKDFVITKDGGYVLTGWTSYEMLLIKTDEDGNQEWLKTFNEEGSKFAGAVLQTEDGGYLVYGGSNEHPMLLKTDAKGNKIWIKEYNYSHLDEELLIDNKDSTFVIAGCSDMDNLHGFAYIIDNKGEILKSYFSSDIYICGILHNHNNEGYIITGKRKGANPAVAIKSINKSDFK